MQLRPVLRRLGLALAALALLAGALAFTAFALVWVALSGTCDPSRTLAECVGPRILAVEAVIPFFVAAFVTAATRAGVAALWRDPGTKPAVIVGGIAGLLLALLLVAGFLEVAA